jgi:ERCC4-type nuclease
MTHVILVDVHERPSRVPWCLERLGLNVQLEALAVGDYVVATGVIVERKTVRSLHTAVAEGTFWAQLGRLRRCASQPFLLLEGPNLDHGSLSQKSIRGVCLAVMEQGIHVIRATTAQDSAVWLARLSARSQAVRGRARRPVPDQKPAVAPSQVPEAMLSAVPGISAQTARALLRRFGSLAAIAMATDEQLRSVRGMGPTRAAAIALAFSRASSAYAEEGRIGYSRQARSR